MKFLLGYALSASVLMLAGSSAFAAAATDVAVDPATGRPMVAVSYDHQMKYPPLKAEPSAYPAPEGHSMPNDSE